MKRTVIVGLCVLLSLSLFACGSPSAGVSSSASAASSNYASSSSIGEPSGSDSQSSKAPTSEPPSSSASADEAAPSLAGSWDSYTFIVEGYEVHLGETTLRELVDNTSFGTIFEVMGYPADGNPLEPGIVDNGLSMRLDSPEYNNSVVYAGVMNKTDATVNTLDATLVSCSFRVGQYGIDAGGYPDVVIPGNLRLGKSTIDDMYAAYGTNYTSEENTVYHYDTGEIWGTVAEGIALDFAGKQIEGIGYSHF